MIAEFTVFLPEVEHLSTHLADVLAHLDARGIEYFLGPTSTSMRGDSKKIFAALESSFELLHRRCDEVIMTVQLVQHFNEQHSLTEAIDAVEKVRLGLE